MGQPIESPAPQPPLYGVVAALATIDDPETRWAIGSDSGVEFEPEACGEAFSAPIMCGRNGAGYVIGDPNQNGRVQNYPIWHAAVDQCSPAQMGRDWQGRARRALEATQSYMIAQELWAGAIARSDGVDNTPLTAATANVVGTGPLSEVNAMACLDQALSNCLLGRRGIIHVTDQLFIRLASLQLVFQRGNQWQTAKGTLVIADAGYDGSGPGDPPDAGDGTTQWAYATSMMRLRLGPVELLPRTEREVLQQMDRATNTVRAIAGRLALIQWDECCHLAVEVDLPSCGV